MTLDQDSQRPAKRTVRRLALIAVEVLFCSRCYVQLELVDYSRPGATSNRPAVPRNIARHVGTSR